MHLISKEQVQGLLNYLGTRPYAEVYKIVVMLTTLRESQVDKPTDKLKKKDGS